MNPVRVLVVDDSATMRGLISAALRRDPGIEVVGQAADPLEAREAIKALNPDVMTLDVEMPKMDGLEFLEKVMRLRPLPVVMVSSLTARGADGDDHARMALGAVDCIGKPSIDHPNSFDELPAQACRAAAGARMQPLRPSGGRAGRRAAPPTSPMAEIVAIGASTGGVEALIAVIAGYPANCPPTVITAHMPSPFTAVVRAPARRAARAAGRRSRRRRADRSRPRLSGAGHPHASRGRGRRPSALPPQQRRSGQRPPPVGRRAVRVGRPRPSARARSASS